MTPKPCLVCGTPTVKSRCAQHEADYQAARNASPQRAKYTGSWARQSRELIRAYRAVYGDTCPGYWCGGPHPIDPSQWVTDHGEGPMCREGNSRKGAVHDRDGKR